MAYGTFSSRAASKKSGRSGLVALVLAAAAGGLVYVSSPGLAKTATELVIGPQYTWDSDFPKPNGTESVGTSTIAVYTPAQQEQYGAASARRNKASISPRRDAAAAAA